MNSILIKPVQNRKEKKNNRCLAYHSLAPLNPALNSSVIHLIDRIKIVHNSGFSVVLPPLQYRQAHYREVETGADGANPPFLSTSPLFTLYLAYLHSYPFPWLVLAEICVCLMRLFREPALDLGNHPQLYVFHFIDSYSDLHYFLLFCSHF